MSKNIGEFFCSLALLREIKVERFRGYSRPCAAFEDRSVALGAKSQGSTKQATHTMAALNLCLRIIMWYCVLFCFSPSFTQSFIEVKTIHLARLPKMHRRREAGSYRLVSLTCNTLTRLQGVQPEDCWKVLNREWPFLPFSLQDTSTAT